MIQVYEKELWNLSSIQPADSPLSPPTIGVFGSADPSHWGPLYIVIQSGDLKLDHHQQEDFS